MARQCVSCTFFAEQLSALINQITLKDQNAPRSYAKRANTSDSTKWNIFH